MLRSLIAASVLGLAACAGAQEAEPENSDCLLAGQWVNERGSAVTLSCQGDQLSGIYNTNVGQPDKDASFPLIGWVEGDTVSFTVNFKGFGSITAWVGQVETIDGEEQLKTLWHLTRGVDEADEPADMWKSITAGASVFRRGAVPENDGGL